MAASAGYAAVLYVSGTSTALTDEACSLVSGKIYQVTDTAKRALDPAVAVAVEDNGVAVAASDIEDIDYLFGKITFAASYTPTTPITIATGSYLPLAIYSVARSCSISLSRSVYDSSAWDGSSSHRQKKVGLKDASGSIGALDYAETSIGSSTFLAKHQAGTPFVLAFGPEGNVTTSKSIRARVLLENIDLSADVDNLVEDSLNFVLSPTTSVEGYEVSYSLDS